MNPHAEILALIQQVDRIIHFVHLLWLDAPASSPQRAKFSARTDDLLDERLRLMRVRDALSPTIHSEIGNRHSAVPS